MATREQQEKAVVFRALHEGPAPLVLPNAWDIASARLIEAAGFPALATTSAGICYALGYPDRQCIPRDEMLEAVARIAARVELPVSADLENGYGETPEAVAETLEAAIAAGVVGCNLEDGTNEPAAPLVDRGLMVEKIAAARAVADAAGLAFVINARSDGFLAGGSGPAVLAEAIARGRAYRAAGADCIFVPACVAEADIRALASEIDGPVNILAGPGTPPLARLAELGVRRVSTGSSLMRAAYQVVRAACAELTGPGSYDYASGALSWAELDALSGGKA
jgi:2-methylisocitrate lyase-like PEP mutase family enzyme